MQQSKYDGLGKIHSSFKAVLSNSLALTSCKQKSEKVSLQSYFLKFIMCWPFISRTNVNLRQSWQQCDTRYQDKTEQTGVTLFWEWGTVADAAQPLLHQKILSFACCRLCWQLHQITDYLLIIKPFFRVLREPLSSMKSSSWD